MTTPLAGDAMPMPGAASPERTSRVSARDGTGLFVRDWPAERPVGRLLLVHGLGEHSGRYAHVAAALNAAGIAVRGFDLRGHGRSDGARGAIGADVSLLDDLESVLADYSAPGLPSPVLMGHSMGGAIAARYAIERRPVLAGLVLSSPALALRMSGAQRFAHAIAERLFPNLGVPNGLRVERLSHARETVDAYRADPLVHGKISARLLRFLLDSTDVAAARGHELELPVLLVVSGDDALVDPAGSRRFHERLPPAARSLAWYEEAWHEAFNERADIRQRAFADLVGWVSARFSASPQPR